LRATLEAEAAKRNRSLSNLIRVILVAHTAPRIVARETAVDRSQGQHADG
jgi:hypothetical protein